MRKALLLAASSLALLVGGCAAPGVDPSAVVQAPPVARADVNPGYQAGYVAGIADKPTPGLEELINVVPAPKEIADPEDRLRIPAMKETALSYGVRGGLAHASRQINRTLQERSAEFTRIYDFGRLMVAAPGGAMVLPPVISEARDTYEMADAGKTLRVADQYFEIVEQARFSPVAPLWHSYLIREYTPPSPPPEQLLPRSDGERDYWRKWVSEGWMMGIQQAHEIFQADLNRLERDFTGMVKYKQLLAEGKVTAPVVAEGRLGVTGTGQDMRVNDRALRITRDPTLKVNPGDWDPAVSDRVPVEAATPPGGMPAVPVEPRPALRRQ